MYCSAPPTAEIEARLRLARRPLPNPSDPLELGELTVDEHTQTVRLADRQIVLTHPEFELLAHLARHPGPVFTREQLLTQLWRPDYTSGTRTVDDHIKRLRKKLGPEHEHIVSTVHNVGYQLTPQPTRAAQT